MGYEYTITASMNALLGREQMTYAERLDALRRRLIATIPWRDRQEDEDLGEAFDQLIEDFDSTLAQPEVPEDDFNELVKDFYDFCDAFRVEVTP